MPEINGYGEPWAAVIHPSATPPQFRECHGCGTFQHVPPLVTARRRYRSRCSTILHRADSHPIDHSIALNVTGLVLLIVMCTTALMSVQTGHRTQRLLFSVRPNS